MTSLPLGVAAGTYGVNHGVEQHADVVEYSRERLEHFKKTCEAFDEFEFCEPQFVVSCSVRLRYSNRRTFVAHNARVLLGAS